MPEPIVFVSHFRIKEGKVEPYRQLQGRMTKQLEADKPRTLAYLAYLSEDGTRATIVHAFADAEAMDLHFEGADSRSRKAYEFLVPEGWEIYGRPTEATLDGMRREAATAHVTLTVQPEFAPGFLRSAPG